jgi:fused signal recognition particle receptor
MAWFKKKKDPEKKETTDRAIEPRGFAGRLRKGLSKTRDILTTDIDDLFRSNRFDDLMEELEERLITSDIGVQPAMEIIERVSRKKGKINSADDLKAVLRDEIVDLMGETCGAADETITASPHVIMVLGVNGVGKTTTIGKLAARYAGQGKSVLIAASDTFRAAAVEQLGIWAEQAGADFVRHRDKADPAAVAFDGVEAGVARKKDVVIVDTAGRLHTKTNLMEELKKIKRAMGKKLPEAPHETLLVLDATTGQNALSQAKMFHEALGVTGIALAKLDGTARGGIVVNIRGALGIPLKYVGIGERIEDLQTFDPARFAEALF